MCSTVLESNAPAGDDFYNPPSELPAGRGDLVWSRSLLTVAGLEAAQHNELVLYRSTALDGRPIAVSGIVALPPTHAPAAGYPVISWAHGSVGLGARCAPSRDRRDQPPPLDEQHRVNQAPHVLLNAFLRRGWAVVMTDYEGMGTPGPHPYLVGESEARAVLDIVRAARHRFPEVSGPLAIVGHSQGGQAALFAGHHARDWAPRLDLRAVAALAPASHLREQVLAGSQLDTPGPGARTAPYLTGALVGDGSIDPRQVLADRAYELFEAARDECRAELGQPDSLGGLPGREQFRGDIAHNPNEDQRKFLRQLELMHPAVEVHVPIRVAQAANDTRVAIEHTDQLVTDLKAARNDVTYRTYQDVEDHVRGLGAHFGILKAETDDGEIGAWLAERLA